MARARKSRDDISVIVVMAKDAPGSCVVFATMEVETITVFLISGQDASAKKKNKKNKKNKKKLKEQVPEVPPTNTKKEISNTVEFSASVLVVAAASVIYAVALSF